MSQVRFKTEHNGKRIEVMAGWDPPLRHFFLTVFDLDPEADTEVVWSAIGGSASEHGYRCAFRLLAHGSSEGRRFNDSDGRVNPDRASRTLKTMARGDLEELTDCCQKHGDCFKRGAFENATLLGTLRQLAHARLAHARREAPLRRGFSRLRAEPSR